MLVLLQILLAATTIAAWALRRSKPVQTAMEDVSLLSHLIRPLFSRVAGWVQRQRLAHVSADVRDRAKAKTGLLQSHYALYGPASYLPILIAAQVFGIAFNLGAIATTVALEWFSDLAFGWGSALDVQPQTIHDLARFIALPWSWAFGEGLGYPTLEQSRRVADLAEGSPVDAGRRRPARLALVSGAGGRHLRAVATTGFARAVRADPKAHIGRPALYPSTDPGALCAHGDAEPGDRRRRKRHRTADADPSAA